MLKMNPRKVGYSDCQLLFQTIVASFKEHVNAIRKTRLFNAVRLRHMLVICRVDSSCRRWLDIKYSSLP